MHPLAMFFLAAVAIGGVLWVFVYPIISGERTAERRMASVAKPEPVAVRTSRVNQKSRRDSVESTLKELEERAKEQKRLSIAARISQAGLSWSKRQFIIISTVLGAAIFLIVLVGEMGFIAAVALG